MKKLKLFLKCYFYYLIYLLFRSKRMRNKYCKYKYKIYKNFSREGCKNHIFKVSFFSKNKKHYLIVGRILHWDSLAKHTFFFLNEIDFNTDEVYVYDENAHALLLYSAKNKFETIIECPISSLDASNFDMMIYTSPLTHNNLGQCDWSATEYDINVLPNKRAVLNFAYLVWDGTVAHPKWVEMINNYFDAVFTPQEHLKQAFIQSGVKKPVFCLLNSFSYDVFRDEKRHPLNQPFVFGWNGTFETRKNLWKLTRAFIKAFAGNSHVLLHLHMRYLSGSADSAEYQDFIKLISKHKNIIFEVKQLSVEDNINLMKSYDAYVFPSMAEGYSVTPREALACGHALIISDIKTHQSITNLSEQDGVFWIHAAKPIVIHQLDMDLGVQYDCEEEDIVIAMKKLYDNRNDLYSDAKIETRKNNSLKYDALNVSKYFWTVLHSEKIELSNKNEICRDSIVTQDKILQNKWGKK